MWPREEIRFASDVLCVTRGQNIGILGGTFNPPHRGHLYIAEKIFHEFSLDKILLLPVGTPPHKLEDPVLDRALRRSMVQLMANERPFFELCTLELDRAGYTYTIDTLRTLRQTHPKDTRFYYIIGTDTLFELPTWKQYEQVFSLVTFLCVARPGDQMDRVYEQIASYQKRFCGRVLLSSHIGPDISSTRIREMFGAGESIRGLVTDSVLEFMEQNHVFRTK